MSTGASGTTSSLVIAGRLILLLLAAFATLWAFALSGGRDHAAPSAGEHVHGAYAGGVREYDDAASGHGAHAHGAHAGGAGQHDHGASGAGPATSPASVVAESATPHDHKVVGTPARRVVVLEVRAPAWLETNGRVTVVLHNDELAGLSAGEHGLFFRATAPAQGIDVRLTAEPPAAWDRSTSRVHFRLDPRASGPRPGEVGWVKLAARSREVLVVPSSAVLYSPRGPYVLAAGADERTFSARPVEIGTVSRGLAVVLFGLHDGEPIVVGSPFFWDAERRLQPRQEHAAEVRP
jgi:hypothetical protein